MWRILVATFCARELVVLMELRPLESVDWWKQRISQQKEWTREIWVATSFARLMALGAEEWRRPLRQELASPRPVRKEFLEFVALRVSRGFGSAGLVT